MMVRDPSTFSAQRNMGHLTKDNSIVLFILRKKYHLSYIMNGPMIAHLLEIFEEILFGICQDLIHTNAFKLIMAFLR